MKEVKTVLVGLDFQPGSASLTEGSRTAAKRALDLAGHVGAQVEYLHAAYWNPEHESVEPPASHAERLRSVEALVKERGGSGKVTLTDSDEAPWLALTHRVLAKQADLVVVAKRNQSKVQDRRLGSTSLKLIHNCPGAVWVVRPDHHAKHRKILAATDLSPVGDRAVEYAAFMAEAELSELHVVHAWQMTMELQMSAGRISEEEFQAEERAIVQKAEDHIRAVPGVAALGEQVTLTIQRDTPSHAVLVATDQHDPDLAVFGTVSRGGIAGLLVGNTAERLLYRLDCSLLTVKPDDFVCPVE